MARPPTADSRLLQLIARIYDAAQDPAQWPSCLQMLSKEVGGRGAILLHHDLARGGTIAESVDIDPEALRLYALHYHAVDPWAQSLRTQELLKPGRAIPDQWLMSRSQLTGTEHYTDFSQRFDLSRMVSMSLFRGRFHSGISILRSERDPEFSTSETRYLEALIPHLQRSLEISTKLSGVALKAAAEGDGLDALPWAFMTTDAECRVYSANRLAAGLTLSADGIAIVNGTLTAAPSASRDRLRKLCASTTCQESVLSRGGTACLLSPRGLPIHVRVAPATRSAGHAFHSPRPCALVFVSDPSQDHPPDHLVLGNLFDLTPAEAKVAALIAMGHSLETIAEQRQLTVETVRWYNKQVLTKVGCHSRGELVRTLARSLANLQIRDESDRHKD